MIRVIQSEYIKLKRTFAKRLAIIGPMLFILLAIPQKLFMTSGYSRPWNHLLIQVFNWWSTIFISLGIALFAALIQLQEKRAGNYGNLRIHSLSPLLIWNSKIIVISVYNLISTIIFTITIVILGKLTAHGEIPWIKILTGSFILWLTSLTIIPLQIWIATWKGTVASISMGFIGIIIGVIAAAKSYWVFIPWSWPIRLMCPIIGVHPNGLPLNTGDPLLNTSVIPVGICISIISFITFNILTGLWFNTREVY